MARKGIRIALLASLVALCILIVINLIAASSSGSISGSKDIFVWTKAICNEKNYCLDVQITCISGQVVDVKPQSEGVYFSGNWRDPRPEDARTELC